MGFSGFRVLGIRDTKIYCYSTCSYNTWRAKTTYVAVYRGVLFVCIHVFVTHESTECFDMIYCGRGILVPKQGVQFLHIL